MSGEVLQQIMLLRAAVGNVIDNNPSVTHISLLEIWEWIDDIMGMMVESIKD